jgi:carbonic anhydrase
MCHYLHFFIPSKAKVFISLSFFLSKMIFNKIVEGHKQFRNKYVSGHLDTMHDLAVHGQHPKIMMISCCDSRVDPALICSADPGDLFMVRNVANIVPHYDKNNTHDCTSAALEFGINFLKVKHLIIMGHSQCGGIQALLHHNKSPASPQNDFISNWVSVIKANNKKLCMSDDDYAKLALKQSKANCLTFPWIKQQLAAQELMIHLWFFNIIDGQVYTYVEDKDEYVLLDLVQSESYF